MKTMQRKISQLEYKLLRWLKAIRRKSCYQITRYQIEGPLHASICGLQ